MKRYSETELIELERLRKHCRDNNTLYKASKGLYDVLKSNEKKGSYTIAINRLKRIMGAEEIEDFDSLLFDVWLALMYTTHLYVFWYAPIPREKDNKIYKVVFIFNYTNEAINKYYDYIEEHGKSWLESDR